MTDRLVVFAAGVVLAVAYLELGLPLTPGPGMVVGGVILGVGIAVRKPALLIIGMALLAGHHAQASAAALREPLPAHIGGTARLVSDPKTRDFDTQVVLDLGGRRYMASVARDKASPVNDLLTGEKVRVVGRSKPFDGAPAGWVASRHLAGRLTVSEISPVPGTRPWYALANGLRRLIGRGAGSLGDDVGPLYLGLVVGDDRGQSELLKFRFQSAGLTHLLAVSGQNVAFLLGVAAPVTRRLGTTSRIVASVVVLVVFTLVTRAEPSVLRAVVMAAVALVAVANGRVAPGIRVLSMTAILLTLMDPLIVHSIAFQLSVCATGGLLVMTRPIEERLPGPAWVRLPLAVTLAAQAATAPVLLGLTGGIPAAGTPANLLAVPAAGFVMMLGVTVGLPAGLLRDSAARVLLFPAEVLVRWISWVATIASKLPLPMLGPGRLLLAGLGIALVLYGHGNHRSRVKRVALAIACSCMVVSCWPSGVAVGSADIGDGARLWSGVCGTTVLELGPDVRRDKLLGQLWGLGVRQVDLVVVNGGRKAVLAARLVQDQFGAHGVLVSGPAAPPGMSVLDHGSSLKLGDVSIARSDDDDRLLVVRPVRAACRF